MVREGKGCSHTLPSPSITEGLRKRSLFGKGAQGLLGVGSEMELGWLMKDPEGLDEEASAGIATSMKSEHPSSPGSSRLRDGP